MSGRTEEVVLAYLERVCHEGDLVMVREVAFDVVDPHRAGSRLAGHRNVLDVVGLLARIGGVPATLRPPGVPA